MLDVSGQPAREASIQDELRSFLNTLDETAAREYFSAEDDDILLKSTISVCNTCLQFSSSLVFQRGKKVWLTANCNAHGIATSLVENDSDFYRLSNKDCWGVRYNDERVFDIPEYSSCCGESSSCGSAQALTKPETGEHHSQMENKSCTVLLEVTNACNLACRVCYADAKGDRILSMGEIRGYISDLISAKGFLDSVQITGGEATIHPDFWGIVAWLYEQDGIGKIYLPTNGV